MQDASGARQNLKSCTHSSGWGTPQPRTGTGGRSVAQGMTSPIALRHVSEPGLVVLDITAADEEKARALMDGLSSPNHAGRRRVSL